MDLTVLSVGGLSESEWATFGLVVSVIALLYLAGVGYFVRHIYLQGGCQPSIYTTLLLTFCSRSVYLPVLPYQMVCLFRIITH